MPAPATPRLIRLPLDAPPEPDKPAPFPTALTRPGTRSDEAAAMALLPNVRAVASWTLAPASRSGEAAAQAEVAADARVLALEAADGTTVFIRADALAERVARVQPQAIDADGALDLARFRLRDADTRGVGEWLWRQVSALAIDPDDVLDAARDAAVKALGDRLGDQAGDWAVAGASWLGAKALMAAVESRLAGEPGLYHWRGTALESRDHCDKNDARLAELAVAAKPALVFIHGTGSSTLGSFGDLPGSTAWEALTARFEEHIFGFEHRTFSESPIDNALTLLHVLPAEAHISLVTHSRGGLVGDLLCLDPEGDVKEMTALIRDYRREPRLDELEAEDANADLRELRKEVAADEQRKLGELVKLLRNKKIVVERYVRVACPARGTALLSDNLEVVLSGLLTLVRKFGAWSTGAVAGLLASPAAAVAARTAADRGLRCLTRVVLEIADKRLQPQVVPGIEAMLPEAPMGMFLARAPCRVQHMAVIAGDIEGGGLVKRIGVMFTDWLLFDRAQNDLVVDTASMYGGVASRGGPESADGQAAKACARAIFVQGAEVNHFRYFRDSTLTESLPLPQAMRRWLLEAAPEKLSEWAPLPAAELPTVPRSRGVADERPKNQRPVVVYLPGIMGSELDADGERVWLAWLHLINKGLGDIAVDCGKKVKPKDVIDLAYGKLKEHLKATHFVETFTYDWRTSTQQLGDLLAKRLDQVLKDHPDQPVRILAHSMGGLVVRAAFATDDGKAIWKRIVERPGGRLVMLGTPNHGSHLMVQTLFGLSETIRLLARIDRQDSMPDVLRIVGGFQGAIDLLPAPGFTDTGGYESKRYYDAAEWERLAEVNDDFWFGKNLCGRPTQPTLNATGNFWQAVADTSWLDASSRDRVSYVFGQSNATPCGLVEQRDAQGRTIGLLIVETPFGDGSVTWASGRLPAIPAENCWLMPADHMGLTNTPKFFGDIDALLEGGAPHLERLPVTRGEDITDAPTSMRRAGPPPAWPTELEAASRLLGGIVAPPVKRRTGPPMTVCVKAANVRFIEVPVVFGHYQGDPIAGAERVIDECLVKGALSHRDQLGIHSGEPGSATVVLMPRSIEERKRQTGRGAIGVGLGEMGRLSADGVSEAVRAGVLRYLLHAADRYGDECLGSGESPANDSPQLALPLASLLIGSNSAAQLDLGEAARAVVLGVLRANRDFNRRSAQRGVCRAYVTRLELVELYLDTAISAAHAMRTLNADLRTELELLGARLEPTPELTYGEGYRPRLNAVSAFDYWPRLSITDADRDEHECDAECYTPRIVNPIPPEALKRLFAVFGCGGPGAATDVPPTGLDLPPIERIARSLRYIYMGEKARAESVVQQRQPGLVERFADDALRGPGSTVYSPGSGFGATLFQLLVPLEFKAAARKTRNLILMVDETTANLPWEMLEADGGPLVQRTRMVRQFISPNFRREVSWCNALAACVISDPNTEGYHAQFGGPGWKPKVGADGRPQVDRLPPLPAAAREGTAICGVLERAGYVLTVAPPDAPASTVFQRLLAQPYRVLVINAHGVFGKRAVDGSYRSGVVLSDGLLLSAAEISLMESVPDLVFLNCCHLARSGVGGNGNRLAAGLSRKLIEMGVRCVVAAGWEVRDDAAQTFAETFFERMAVRGEPFGEAIFQARNATLAAHHDCNTWGAYQAYGDPSFRLTTKPSPRRDDDPLSAAEELVEWIAQRRLGECRPDVAAQDLTALRRRVTERLDNVPAAWLAATNVQEALARLWSDHLPEGFADAHSAYLKAIAGDSSSAAVPISAMEQLINLEAREAERLTRGAGNQAEASALADSAVTRAEALRMLAGGTDIAINPERQSIFGSTYKRQAIVRMRTGASWSDVEQVLRRARDDYRLGEGHPRASDWNPYACINRLQLDALLNDHGSEEKQIDELVDTCRAAARARFERSYDFFDAVMPVDASVAGWLLTGRLPEAAHAGATPGEILLRSYREAVRDLHAPSRKFKSVVDQLRILSEFLDKRPTASGADPTVSSVLRRLADALDGKEPSADSRGAAKPDKARPEDAQDAGQTPAPPGPNTKAAPKRQPRKPGGTPPKKVS